jgi:glycosyltransferase involved in cell wall biosynthesis
MDSDIRFSIVIPAYNEEESLPILMEELRHVFHNLPKPAETILVNDGSTDRTLQVMLELKKKYDELSLKVISLDGNYGLTAALDAGFHTAKEEVIVSLDADLQNDPADIPKLLEKISDYDAVIGVRRKRMDRFIKKISSKIANSIRDFILSEKWRDTGCTLKAYRKSYLEKIKLFNGLHRFLPTLLLMEKARILELDVNHRERTHGKSKYGLWNRLFGPFRDLMAVRWMKQQHLSYTIEEK